jgi:hypothetical protein
MPNAPVADGAPSPASPNGNRKASVTVRPDVVRPDDGTFAAVLGEAALALEQGEVPYAVIGGVASSGLGRQRVTRDIDILVKPEDARPALQALRDAGFHTEETDAQWLFKGWKHEVLVDIIFSSRGGVHMDPEMLSRAVVRPYMGQQVRVVSPEDLLIMKALAHDEEGPRHWHDALGLIANCDLDWEYLQRRARRAPHRILSLLVYARSLDLFVPNRVIRSLFDSVYG